MSGVVFVRFMVLCGGARRRRLGGRVVVCKDRDYRWDKLKAVQYVNIGALYNFVFIHPASRM